MTVSEVMTILRMTLATPISLALIAILVAPTTLALAGHCSNIPTSHPDPCDFLFSRWDGCPQPIAILVRSPSSHRQQIDLPSRGGHGFLEFSHEPPRRFSSFVSSAVKHV